MFRALRVACRTLVATLRNDFEKPGSALACLAGVLNRRGGSALAPPLDVVVKENFSI